MDMNWTLFRLY